MLQLDGDPGHVSDLLVTRLHLCASDLVIEVGSGDGSLLRAIRARGPRVLGVEPTAHQLSRAFAAGIDTLRAAFDQPTAELIRRRYGPARVIITPRLPVRSGNPCAFLAAARTCLSQDGIMVLRARDGLVEVPRAPRQPRHAA